MNFLFISLMAMLLGMSVLAFGDSKFHPTLMYVDDDGLVYNTSGNISINATSPNYRLLVSGNMHIEENPTHNRGGATYFPVVNQSSATVEIDWRKGNYQHLTVNEAMELTFVAPEAPCNLILLITRTNTGSITWPTSNFWMMDVQPDFSSSEAAAAGRNVDDLIGYYFDGEVYHAAVNLDFQ